MSRKEQAAWIVGGAGLALFILLQFLPVWWFAPSLNLTNPPVVTRIRWNSPETAEIVERACYMCHSNETRLPLYMQIAPLSWLAAQRVNNGRARLNFSEESLDQIPVSEIIEVIETDRMPPSQYRLLHPEAVLSDSEKARLVAGIRATFTQYARTIGEG